MTCLLGGDVCVSIVCVCVCVCVCVRAYIHTQQHASIHHQHSRRVVSLHRPSTQGFTHLRMPPGRRQMQQRGALPLPHHVAGRQRPRALPVVC